MLFGETEVRANIRNRDGKRVFYLGKGDQLTSGAKDYLNRERIPVLPANQAKPERFALLSGGFTEEKPEHMTHLNAQVLVPKTHPRIAFRGAMDSLEAEIMLCQLKVPEPFKTQLTQLLELTRLLIRCDVLEEPVKEQTLCGMTADELRQRSHRPQEYYGQAHFMPQADDGEPILALNRVRCAVRHGELMAAAAFADRDGVPTRVDILQALNRMSSMIWIMMIQMKKEKL
jgi:ethanolamine utilization cobalamin adenosyltransferase